MVVEVARAAFSFFAFLAEEVKRERRKDMLRWWRGAEEDEGEEESGEEDVLMEMMVREQRGSGQAMLWRWW